MHRGTASRGFCCIWTCGLLSGLIGQSDDLFVGNNLTTYKIYLTYSPTSHQSRERPFVDDILILINFGFDQSLGYR